MKKQSALFTMTSCALMAALMCALCPVSVPIGPVPISLSILVILLTVMILGTRDALVSYTVYLLLGAAGMPVFSGFQGGLAKLVGPTGGYLVGFLPMILIGGFFMEKSKRNVWVTMIGMVIGIAVDYLLGTAWFVFQTGSTLAHALDVCVYPFIPFDLAKLVIAVLLGNVVFKALVRANLLSVNEGGSSYTFQYFASVCVPLVGFILGAILMADKEPERASAGKVCVLLGIISTVIDSLIIFL